MANMNTGIDPWDVDSPDEIVAYNVDFFFQLFPNVDRSNESTVRKYIQSIVEEAISHPSASGLNQLRRL